MNKCNRILGLMKRLSLTISRKQLLIIHKAFVRPHLGYADTIYDDFKEKLEVHYSAALIITGAMKGTSRERLCKELGFEFLCDRR